jgi:glutathione S-transferase
MITLYGIQSPHVARVRAALIQKGLEFQHVSVNLGNKSEEFLKLTPVDKIPVLEDSDGTIVCDSTYIVDYLDAKYPETYRMMGKNAKEKAKVLNVIAVIERISEVLGPFIIEKFQLQDIYKKRNEKHRLRTFNAEEKQDAIKDITYRLGRMEKMLAGRYFSEQFSAADAAVLSELNTLEAIGADITTWKKWQQELMKDEKIAKMFPSKEEKAIKEI